MKHLKGFRTLNRTHSHRRALYRNMAEALFKNERIKTTVTKAKEIRRVAEKLITKAKNKTLHNIRIIEKLIKDKEILMKLFDDISPRYVNRNGGYTRIIKLARRKGDGAEMAYLELIEEQSDSKKKKKKKIEKDQVQSKNETQDEVKEVEEKSEDKKDKGKGRVKAEKEKKEEKKESTKKENKNKKSE